MFSLTLLKSLWNNHQRVSPTGHDNLFRSCLCCSIWEFDEGIWKSEASDRKRRSASFLYSASSRTGGLHCRGLLNKSHAYWYLAFACFIIDFSNFHGMNGPHYPFNSLLSHCVLQEYWRAQGGIFCLIRESTINLWYPCLQSHLTCWCKLITGNSNSLLVYFIC